MECLPMHSNRELINFIDKPFTWENWVTPLTPRSSPRYLETSYGFLDEGPTKLDENIEVGKVLVCHDMMGNYRNDRYERGQCFRLLFF